MCFLTGCRALHESHNEGTGELTAVRSECILSVCCYFPHARNPKPEVCRLVVAEVIPVDFLDIE